MKPRKLAPGQVIALSFALAILLGAVLLMLPIARNPGVRVAFIDALFTSTSAVCVTGLIAVDTADTFTVFGRTVVALLIQMGGLGVTSLGVGLIAIARGKVNLRERTFIKESYNQGTLRGIVGLVKSVLKMTLCFELVGVLLGFIVFSRDYPLWDALGIAMFHSVAAFNNSGFDILGGLRNLAPYAGDPLLLLTTSGLIIFGGLGFIVIRELIHRKRGDRLSLHAKVVLTVTGALLAIGTVLIVLTERVSWLEAFFYSVSARTAGFSVGPLSAYTNAGLFVITILMFIGASPGSTGGGIKTTTFYVLLRSIWASSTGDHPTAFKRKLPRDIIGRASLITLLALGLVLVVTFLLCVLEPKTSFLALLFETVSAFGTVGLSTGITPDLTSLSKFFLVVTMYIGRLGPLSVACLWAVKVPSEISYAEESLAIG